MKHQKSFNHFKSIDFLPMWNFYQVEKTKDLRYLLKIEDYEYLPDENVDYLAEVWEDMQYQKQDIEIEMSNRQKNAFDSRVSIDKLQLQYYRVQSLIMHLQYEINEEFIKELSLLGFSINRKKDYASELKRIYKSSQGIKTKIALKEFDYKSSFLSSVESKSIDILDTIDSIERQRGIDINPHKTTLKKWLVMMHKIINESNKKALKNG